MKNWNVKNKRTGKIYSLTKEQYDAYQKDKLLSKKYEYLGEVRGSAKGKSKQPKEAKAETGEADKQ